MRTAAEHAGYLIDWDYDLKRASAYVGNRFQQPVYWLGRHIAAFSMSGATVDSKISAFICPAK